MRRLPATPSRNACRSLALTALLLLGMTATAEAQTAAKPGAGRFAARFQAANVTHDGHLTLAQAQQARMRNVANNFAAIDREGKGYLTMADIHAYRRATRAQKAGQMPPGLSPQP